MPQVLVSACLLGTACAWDGRDRFRSALGPVLEGWEVIPVCPEVAGGLPVPRPPCDLSGGDGAAVWRGEARVLGHDGVDRTAAFRTGALRCAAQAPAARVAVLKARSPSCGPHEVHVDGAIRPGRGLLAALLAGQGVHLLSDEDLDAGTTLPPTDAPG